MFSVSLFFFLFLKFLIPYEFWQSWNALVFIDNDSKINWVNINILNSTHNVHIV